MRAGHTHPEAHLMHRIGWLRAAVLGANDGIVSTASLIVGVAAAAESREAILLAGTAGLVAGAMSMAAGEYISVSSQADTEAADLTRERRELATQPEFELRELAGIYEARGLSAQLAAEVARELTERDALGSHARDELGITEVATARPVQAALDIRGDLRGRSRPAAPVDPRGARRRRDPHRCHRRPGRPRCSRGRRSARRRRRPLARSAPCHLLGRARHGGDRRNRSTLRRGGVASGQAVPGLSTSRRCRGTITERTSRAPLPPSPPSPTTRRS